MNWIRRFYIWVASKVAKRHLTAARRMTLDWDQSSAQLIQELNQSIHRLGLVQQQWTAANEEAIELMRDCEINERQHKVVVDALRNENRVLQEVLIPTMTAADKLLLQRYDTELSLLVKRQVAAMGKEEVE
ncbi:hypothetical protein M0R72_14215 [Candidatus Pacearchaeota archaeon]|jgi:hypothetical protein|nr:hypothetical protein [Candidatus Pacearchaeota archaeon]